MNLFNLKSIFICAILIFIYPNITYSQDIISDNTLENIDSLSDKQLNDYYQNALSKGYTLQQIKTFAETKGVSAIKIADFENRVLNYNPQNDIQNNVSSDALKIIDDITVNDTISKTTKKSKIFGKDFFANENISFTPNLNLSTPVNYKLGPGDELVLSIWGAAENTYTVSVNKEGAIKIPNIGPILINGLTISDASEKIRGYLKRIYNGLNAPENSPYRVNFSLSLASVRTVQVNIIGEVNTPGTYSLSSLSTVLNALYASGGPTDTGTFRDIKLVRNGGETIRFDIYKYLTEGNQDGNVTLRDQDVIIVSPYISRIEISGAIKRPGLFELLPNETLEDLLDFTSGFTSNAYKDIIVLERISGDAKRVIEIDPSNASTIKLNDGDDINVKSTLAIYENKVSIEGAVYRPGVFELTNGLTLKKLINKAAGVLDKAFLDRAIIIRYKDGVRSELIAFSVNEVLANKKIILLENNDVVKIYDKYDLKKEMFVTISGAVNNPKKVPFLENLTVEDMVLMAGGYTNQADQSKIDIYRKMYGEDREKLVETIRMSTNGLSSDITNYLSEKVLEPNDRITVRYLKGYKGEIFVSINGEVNYSGEYGLEKQNMRISDLLNLSGGTTNFAFTKGASLTRLNPYFNQKRQIEVVDDVSENLSDKDENITINNASSLSIGIDLEMILKNPGSKYDMILKNGDVLSIPSIRETVKIEGQVLAPSLVRYDQSYNLKDYINNSGGFSENARNRKTYVIYSSGEIAATKNFLFFKSYPKLEPGALVIVPKKPKLRNPLGTQEVIGLTTSLSTLALLINSL